MEEFLQGLGIVAVVLLVVVGLLSGWLASLVAGGHMARYMVLGVVGALLAPVLLALLGVSVIAAGGLVLLLVAAAIGAVIVLALARAVFR